MSLKTVPTQQKYGLIKKGVHVVKKKPSVGVFKSQDELEDEDDELTDTHRVNRELYTKPSTVSNEIERLHEKAKQQDESIFDYDGVYDEMKASTGLASHPLSQAPNNEPPKARYIQNIKAASKLREKESDRVYERKLLKEKEENQDEFSDKPQFITTAYKERLKEKQLWEYEERLQEELDKQMDVRKRGMQGFYSNLLTKNISLGGDVSSAMSAFTAGSVRQDRLLGQMNNITSSHSNDQQNDIKTNEPTPAVPSDPIHDDSNNQERPMKIQRLSESTVSVLEEPPQSTNVISETASTQEISLPKLDTNTVSSTRERYLARKHQRSKTD